MHNCNSDHPISALQVIVSWNAVCHVTDLPSYVVVDLLQYVIHLFLNTLEYFLHQ